MELICEEVQNHTERGEGWQEQEMIVLPVSGKYLVAKTQEMSLGRGGGGAAPPAVRGVGLTYGQRGLSGRGRGVRAERFACSCFTVPQQEKEEKTTTRTTKLSARETNVDSGMAARCNPVGWMGLLCSARPALTSSHQTMGRPGRPLLACQHLNALLPDRWVILGMHS